MNQKQVLERWLRQLQKDEITPDALGLGPNKEEAMKHIKNEIDKLTIEKAVEAVKNQKQ